MRIVMGVTGGIAAYKACEVVSRLKKLGHEVDVIMTENATRLVAPLTFETLSKRPVCVDTFTRTESWDVKHISLAQKAELFLVAPATANLMAKLACGIADDMLTTTLLATKAPILLAPAMNTGMWTAEATQANLRTLQARGVHFVGPESGFLACGYGVAVKDFQHPIQKPRNRLGKGKGCFRRHGQHCFAASHQFLCFGKRLGLRTVRTFRLAAGQNRFFFLASKAKRIKGAQADDQHADRQYHIKALFFHHAVITLIGSFHPGLEFLPSPASFHLHPSRLKFALQPGFPFQSGYSSVPSSVPG